MNILALPEVRGFWDDHPRMQILPEREAEVGGRPAIVTGFESVTSQDCLQIVYSRDDLRLLGIHSGPSAKTR